MTEPVLPRLSFEQTMDGAIGFEILDASETHALGRFAVEDRVRQPLGIVHGGAYAAAAESLCSAATYVGVSKDDSGRIVLGQSNQTSFLRPVSEGSVHVDARPRHRGRTSWVWDVDFTDDEGRVCALSRVTLAVRSAERA
jgi:1,4-dihydroxy-2-naphthoyl-CoA hydrolase